MKLQEIDPYLRAAMIQPAVFEGKEPRMAYDYRLFYILDGKGSVLLAEGERALAADTLLFFAPRFAYQFRGKMRVIVLNFDLTRRADARKKPLTPPPIAGFDPALLFDPTEADGLELPILHANSRLRDDLLAIVHAFHPTDPLADTATSGMLKKIIADLLCEVRGERERTKDLAERVRRYLRLYAGEIKDNREIGRHFGYHPVYLASLFREMTGESLHHALLAERIRLAETWLIRTDDPIEEIAYNTGFSSRSHFCTTFKTFIGISPKQYRQSKRQSERG